MWKTVKGTAKIKIDGVSLTLWTDESSNKVTESDQIGNGRFRVDKNMLEKVQFRF
jgi:hypothetical protein